MLMIDRDNINYDFECNAECSFEPCDFRLDLEQNYKKSTNVGE